MNISQDIWDTLKNLNDSVANKSLTEEIISYEKAKELISTVKPENNRYNKELFSKFFDDYTPKDYFIWEKNDGAIAAVVKNKLKLHDYYINEIQSFKKGYGAKLLQELINKYNNLWLLADPTSSDSLKEYYRSFGLKEVVIDKNLWGNKPISLFYKGNDKLENAIREYYTDKSVVNENIIFNEQDKKYNFDKFESSKENILLITGLSGSGKSTISTELEKAFNATVIELDYLDCYSFGTTYNDEGEERDTTLKDLANSKGGRIIVNWIKKNKIEKAEDDDERKELLNEFFMYLLDYCERHKNQRFIVNGLQLYNDIDKSLLRGLPTIVKGTSALTSTLRSAKRDSSYDPNTTVMKSAINKLPQNLRDEKKLRQFKKLQNNER